MSTTRSEESDSDFRLKTAEGLISRKELLSKDINSLIESTKGSLTELDAEVALRSCLKYEKTIEKLTDEICALNPYLKKLNKVSTHELGVYQAQIDAIVKHCYAAKKANASSKEDTQHAKLPRITLPKWGGEISAWMDFKAQFDIIVHQRKDITETVKLQYLKASLGGEPLAIVNQYPLEKNSYEIAYKDLVHRYENKRRLASYYINKILNFKASTSSPCREHINFIEVHRTASSALKGLGIDLTDFILFDLSYRNLSIQDRKRFDVDHCDEAVPTLQQLLSFVEKMARSEELSLDKEQTSGVKVTERNKAKPQVIKRSLVVSKQTYVCFYCRDDHMIHRCPKFLALPVDSRKAQVEQLGCCVACLYKHPKKVCKSKYCCKICGSKLHNTVLHPESDTSSDRTNTPSLSSSSGSVVENPSSVSKTCNSCITAGSGSAVILGTLQCCVKDNWGQQIRVRAVVDPGSEISIVTSHLLNRLGLPRSPPTCQISGVDRIMRKPSGDARLQISSLKSSGTTHQLEAAVLPEICGPLPKSRLPSSLLEKFKTLELADPGFCEPGRIDLLLGLDAFSDFLATEEPIVIPGSPAAFRTLFGYVIMGRLTEPSALFLHRNNPQKHPPNSLNQAASLNISAVPLDDSIKRFWETEEVTHEIPPDPADVLCEQHFQRTYQRDPSGRFVVRLPFLPNVPALGNNEEMALKRLKYLERRLAYNSNLADAYRCCLQEYIDLGHISVNMEKASYLLPHHAVMKESSSTTKCRVVFDCSAPDDLGLSLNDRLYRGPPLLNDISLLLINFRFFQICLMADIKMMYRMVVVHPEDRKHLVIAWRDQQYRMNRLPFGLKPAGYLASRCIIQLANLYGSEFPAAAKAIRENRYADDFCTGAATLEEAKQLQEQLTRLLAKGGFEIRRWSSNCPDALVDVPELSKETPVKLPSGELGVKVLGVLWDQSHDAFVARVVPFDARIISKRTILSYIARIYDAMGFFSPTIFMAKYFVQRLWLQQLEWDEPLPPASAEEWNHYAENLLSLCDVKIPRLLPSKPSEMRLVGFSDASEKGMAASVYIHWNSDNSAPQSRLLKSKTKLAPLKTLTIPRLELCGALLLAKLAQPIIELLGKKVKSTNFYTDSRIVLAWLNHPPHELQIFVGNRVAEISRTVPTAIWGHVSGMENPADLGSRGLSARLLKDSELWWNGPSFLKEPYHTWPGKPPDLCRPDQLPELKRVLNLNIQAADPADVILRRFSSFSRMQRVLGYILRYTNKVRRVKDYRDTSRPSGPLSTTELQTALHVALRLSQREAFGVEIENIKEGGHVAKPLRKLSPFYDHRTGLVRVGGRLGQAMFLPEDARHPFLLSKNCHLSSLIVDHYHELYLHSGPRTTCAAIQRKFWILSLMTLVKARTHRCRRCHKLNSKPGQPIMADVIPARLDQTYCWANCATDFGGPFMTKESNLRKSTLHKSYICIFVCLTTRALHLEMVTDLTTAAFLAAFSRFTARRSVPNVIYSDRGTNFVGARGILREARDFLLSHKEEIFSAAAAIGTKWRLNAPQGPNFNGCAENGIKSAKALIKRKVGEQVLTFEEFQTLLCRVEQILNSRPISFSSHDVNDRDIVYLTPGHFITGREMTTPPEEPLEENLKLRDRWKRVRQMSQSFWKVWSISYLHELMQRHKWNRSVRNLKVGDLVYVTGINTTPLSWPIGKIVETFTNPADRTVRVARVRVRDRDIIRPASKLVIIPMEQ